MTMLLRVRQPLVDTDRYSEELAVGLLGQRVHILHAHDHTKPIVSPMSVVDARVAEDGSLDIDLAVGLGQTIRRTFDGLAAVWPNLDFENPDQRVPVTIGYQMGQHDSRVDPASGDRLLLGIRLHTISPAPEPMAQVVASDAETNSATQVKADDPMWSDLFDEVRREVTMPLPGMTLLLYPDPEVENGRWVYQIEFERPDTYTGVMGKGRGGPVHLSPNAGRSGLVRLVMGMALRYAEHEIREGFLYRGRRVFGPHVDIDAQWEIATRTEGSGT